MLAKQLSLLNSATTKELTVQNHEAVNASKKFHDIVTLKRSTTEEKRFSTDPFLLK